MTNEKLQCSDRSSDGKSLKCFETTSNDDDDFGNLVEGDQITLACQIIYYELWGPTQNWTDSVGRVLDASDVSAGNVIEYTYSVSATLSQWLVGVNMLLYALETTQHKLKYFRQLSLVMTTDYIGLWIHIFRHLQMEPFQMMMLFHLKDITTIVMHQSGMKFMNQQRLLFTVGIIVCTNCKLYLFKTYL